ncbi:MAG: hypothetical protein ACD_74C00137G0008 [uncultured bacterium]|nr:MAG: hypothetical protein ACD_74C00137G0008 [uncultured bacterium]
MKVAKQTEKHQHIARIDQESKRTHGWYVRVWFKGKNHPKFFSDLLHGGRDRSLSAAIAWRNAKEKEIGKPRTSSKIFTMSRTNTGIVGVRFNEPLNRYDVSWVTPDGRQGKTSVSIKEHGREKAFVAACKIREEKEVTRLALRAKE